MSTLSYTVQTTVRLPIVLSSMNEHDRIRLKQIINRDHRVIKRYLGVIHAKQSELFRRRQTDGQSFAINLSRLWELTLTTATRQDVDFDLKTEFPRISTNELQECGLTAVAMVKSYLQLRQLKTNITSFPSASHKLIPRVIHRRRFGLDQQRQEVKLLDSMDRHLDIRYGKKNRVHHYPRLVIPVLIHDYAKQQLSTGEIRSLQLVRKDRSTSKSQLWAHLGVAIKVEPVINASLPAAIVGIDLGISKQVVTALVTRRGVVESRTFQDQHRRYRVKKLDDQISSLQHEADLRSADGRRIDGVYQKLKQLRSARAQVTTDSDRQLIADLVTYLTSLSDQHNLYIALGDLTHIRHAHRRGAGKKSLRGWVHRWSFARFSQHLQHRLDLSGLGRRLYRVKEYYTSSKCHRCGRTGHRRNQSLFVCNYHDCLIRINADKNGAINIGLRLIHRLNLYDLFGETVVSQWIKRE